MCFCLFLWMHLDGVLLFFLLITYKSLHDQAPAQKADPLLIPEQGVLTVPTLFILNLLLCNSLPQSIRSAESVVCFKRLLKIRFYWLAFP